MKLQRIIPFGFLFIVITFSACTNNSRQTDVPDDETSSDQNVTTIQIDNMGATAYVVLGIDGEGVSATLDEENTEIAFRISTQENQA